MIYDRLLMLKRMPEEVLEFYSKLNSRKSEKSKNILVICRTVKDANEALRGMAANCGEGCKINKTRMMLETGERNIIFMPIGRLDTLVGIKYKEYYLEDEYKI